MIMLHLQVLLLLLVVLVVMMTEIELLLLLLLLMMMMTLMKGMRLTKGEASKGEKRVQYVALCHKMQN